MRNFEIIMVCLGSITAIGIIVKLITNALRGFIKIETTYIRDKLAKIEYQTTKTNGTVLDLTDDVNSLEKKVAIINEHLHLQQ